MSFIETHTQLLLTLAWSLDYDTHQYLRKWLEPHLRLRLLKKDIGEFITDSSKKFESSFRRRTRACTSCFDLIAKLLSLFWYCNCKDATIGLSCSSASFAAVVTFSWRVVRLFDSLKVLLYSFMAAKLYKL